MVTILFLFSMGEHVDRAARLLEPSRQSWNHRCERMSKVDRCGAEGQRRRRTERCSEDCQTIGKVGDPDDVSSEGAAVRTAFAAATRSLARPGCFGPAAIVEVEAGPLRR